MDVEMTSVVAPGEAGEREIDRFISRRAQRTGAVEANALAALQRVADARKLEATREQNRNAWIYHLRRTAAAHLRIARDARARARRLEEQGGSA